MPIAYISQAGSRGREIKDHFSFAREIKTNGSYRELACEEMGHSSREISNWAGSAAEAPCALQRAGGGSESGGEAEGTALPRAGNALGWETDTECPAASQGSDLRPPLRYQHPGREQNSSPTRPMGFWWWQSLADFWQRQSFASHLCQIWVADGKWIWNVMSLLSAPQVRQFWLLRLRVFGLPLKLLAFRRASSSFSGRWYCH